MWTYATPFGLAIVGDSIYIIGCIAHPEDRVVGYTPVYRLNTETFVIEKVETSGDNPGWIYNHKATLIDDEIRIYDAEIWMGPDQDNKKAGWLYDLLTNAQKHDASDGEVNETVSPFHITEPPKSPERFALDLKSLNWRRVID